MKREPTEHRASALLLVLWALLVLSAAVLVWAGSIQQHLADSGWRQRASEARAMAGSGLAVALDPAVSRRTRLPRETLAEGQSYEVWLYGEGGRLNLPWLLRGEEPARLDLLRRWLQQKGVSLEQSSRVVDSLLDYVDADNLPRLNGGEDAGAYHPANRELRSLDELPEISGAAPLTSLKNWRDDLTLYSLGPIDLDAAPAEILRLIPGLDEMRVQKFLQFRRGADGLENTADDGVFQSLESMRTFFGWSPAQFDAAAKLISYRDPTVRAVARGFSGEVVQEAVAVYRPGSERRAILFWQEP